jgi:hypothetical protein
MKKYHLFFLTLIYLTGCTKTEVVTNTYSTAEPGTIKGKVILHDTTNVLLTDASGVSVSLEGTKYTTLTAADGSWELDNVPAGTYASLMYSKNGFPTYKSYVIPQYGQSGAIGAYIVGGGGTQYDLPKTLNQISYISDDIVIRAFEDNVDVTQTIFSSRVLDAEKSYDTYYGAIYFGLRPDIDPTNAKTFLYFVGLGQADRSTGNHDFPVLLSDLKNAGFTSGQKVYCAAYFMNSANLSVYYTDPATGTIIFPGFSPYHSEVKSFLLP